METIVITEAMPSCFFHASKASIMSWQRPCCVPASRFASTGDTFVGRVDLKADWTTQKLKVLSVLFEEGNAISKANLKKREAVRTALDRYAEALKLKLTGRRLS